MAEFTKGPWLVEEREGMSGRFSRRILCEKEWGKYVIAEVTYPGTEIGTGGAEQRLANARLIAAAPDLYEALNKIVDDACHSIFETWLEKKCPSGDVESVRAQWLESHEFLGFCDDWRLAIDAIAKAAATEVKL